MTQPKITIDQLNAGTGGSQVLVTDASGNLHLDSSIILSETTEVFAYTDDNDDPQYGWSDLIGQLYERSGGGANAPVFGLIPGFTNMAAYNFDNGGAAKQLFVPYHINHDYAMDTELYLHMHYLDAAAVPDQGAVRWDFEITMAKGHNQQPFGNFAGTPGATETVFVTQNVSATRWQHMLAEVPIGNTVSTLVEYAPSNQDSTVTVHASATARSVAQSFTPGSTAPLRRVRFYLRRVGNPTGNMVAKLYAHSGTFGTSSVPTGSPLATSELIPTSQLSTAFNYVSFFFHGDQQVTLTSGTNYVMVFEYDGGDVSNNIQVGYDGSAPTSPGNYAEYNGTVWTANAARDLIFSIGRFVTGRIEPDTVLLVRVFRNGADALDTSGDDVYALTSDIHFQVGRFSTKNKKPNFYS